MGTAANADAVAAGKAGDPIDERVYQQHPADLPRSAMAGRPIIGQSCIFSMHSVVMVRSCSWQGNHVVLFHLGLYCHLSFALDGCTAMQLDDTC